MTHGTFAHRKTRRRSHVPAEFLERLRHDDGPAGARRVHERRLVSLVSISRGNSSDAQDLAPLFVATAASSSSAVSCGGGDDSPSSPDADTRRPTPTPTPTPNPSTATITITASGVSPRSVTIAAGRPRDVRQQRHPRARHELEPASGAHRLSGAQPGRIPAAGSEPEPTGNLTTRPTCGFHDHNRDTDTSLQGTIVINSE